MTSQLAASWKPAPWTPRGVIEEFEMRTLPLSLAAAALPLAATAQTTLIDTGALPTRQAHEVAELTPLAVSADGEPAVVLLALEAGEVVPPHATESGLRLLTVLAGEMSWGDGDTIDEARETVHPAGSVLVVPAGLDHWLAARGGDVRLQLVVLDDEEPVPALREQMR